MHGRAKACGVEDFCRKAISLSEVVLCASGRLIVFIASLVWSFTRKSVGCGSIQGSTESGELRGHHLLFLRYVTCAAVIFLPRRLVMLLLLRSCPKCSDHCATFMLAFYDKNECRPSLGSRIENVYCSHNYNKRRILYRRGSNIEPVYSSHKDTECDRGYKVVAQQVVNFTFQSSVGEFVHRHRKTQDNNNNNKSVQKKSGGFSNVFV